MKTCRVLINTPSSQGGIEATFELAYFTGWTLCEETKKLMSKPKKPAVSLQQLFDNAPSWSEMEQQQQQQQQQGKKGDEKEKETEKRK